jgi:hypothetical protein
MPKGCKTTFGVIVGLGALMCAAGAAAETDRLPRVFENARLGMAIEELAGLRALPAGAVSARKHKTDAVAVRSRDPHIDHVEYRFYRGVLYEQAIYYKRDRVPRGYAGLLQRLREEYGKPAIDDVWNMDDNDPEVFSSQKTVWRDGRTQLVLTEIHRLREGRDQFDLVLTMTDRQLAQEQEQEKEARLRQQERRVPIPVRDGQSRSRATAEAGRRDQG